MQSLPLILSLLAAALLAPGALRGLGAGPLAKSNFRGETLPCPLGVLLVAGALLALVPLALLQQLSGEVVLRPEVGWIALYVLGVAGLGLADDSLSGGPRGWREHGRAALSGGWSTGALKALGSAGLALYVTLGGSNGHWLLAAAVLVLATNAFNLLDLRPGRTLKAFVLLGAGLTIGAGELQGLWAVGLFAGPVLVVGLLDLRERGLLGDSGSNAIGALAGAWVVLTLSDLGLALSVVLLLGLTAYGEFRSISALIERTPVLREIDWIGRIGDVRNA